MAVTTHPDVADERVALALASLHELTHPDADTVEPWLDFVVEEAARAGRPGDQVVIPTGNKYVHIVLVVPDPSDPNPHDLVAYQPPDMPLPDPR